MYDYEKSWSGEWNDTTLYGPACRHRRRIVADLVLKLDFRSICDLGCGNGRLIFELIQKGVKTEFSGYDISLEAIEQARKLVPGITFGQANLSESLPAQQMDLCIMSEVLEHIEDDGRLLRQLAEKARYVVISVPGGPADKVDLQYGHFRNYDGNTLRDLLAASGFEVIEYFRWGFPLYDFQQKMARRHPSNDEGGGEYSLAKRVISRLVYILYFFNVRGIGEQVFAVARSSKWKPDR